MKDLKKGYTFRNSKTNIVSHIDRLPTKSINSSSASLTSFNPLKFVLGFILLSILFVALFRMTGNIGSGQPLTFTGFLEYLSSLDFGSVNLSIANVSLTDDWGIFNGFRNFINLLLGAFNFMLTITSALVNVVIFLFNIFKFIFIGAQGFLKGAAGTPDCL